MDIIDKLDIHYDKDPSTIEDLARNAFGAKRDPQKDSILGV